MAWQRNNQWRAGVYQQQYRNSINGVNSKLPAAK